ncbi:MAG: 16S rRNA (guanine(527)-N(7))-methyltransferase RsmG [Chloroherpetonaceae bacterium]|nr:16S rRNA (guanine(527)-N(7))-methyltransferase RsmG [Chthonomonadaceae bacterium]MDW8208173.1 16S rRNA (guanine(527)-N(7))-methyltransferase RsmG [Chloroherpetonaceae bacterium]
MLSETQRTQLIAGARAWGVTLDDRAVARFDQFARMLHAANQEFNLTRIRPEDIVPLHFLDSLSVLAVWHPAEGARVLDVGTGAGFPGLPLAIACPQLDITLLDGTRKRLAFVDTVIAALELDHVRTLHGRAEEIVRLPAYCEQFDVTTARAVAKMPRLVQWLLPLTRPGGLAIALKSRDLQDELEQALPVVRALGARVERVAELTLPGTEILRKLVCLRKHRTPSRTTRGLQRRSP